MTLPGWQQRMLTRITAIIALLSVGLLLVCLGGLHAPALQPGHTRAGNAGDLQSTAAIAMRSMLPVVRRNFRDDESVAPLPRLPLPPALVDLYSRPVPAAPASAKRQLTHALVQSLVLDDTHLCKPGTVADGTSCGAPVLVLLPAELPPAVQHSSGINGVNCSLQCSVSARWAPQHQQRLDAALLATSAAASGLAAGCIVVALLCITAYMLLLSSCARRFLFHRQVKYAAAAAAAGPAAGSAAAGESSMISSGAWAGELPAESLAASTAAAQASRQVPENSFTAAQGVQLSTSSPRGAVLPTVGDSGETDAIGQPGCQQEDTMHQAHQSGSVFDAIAHIAAGGVVETDDWPPMLPFFNALDVGGDEDSDVHPALATSAHSLLCAAVNSNNSASEDHGEADVSTPGRTCAPAMDQGLLLCMTEVEVGSDQDVDVAVEARLQQQAVDRMWGAEQEAGWVATNAVFAEHGSHSGPQAVTRHDAVCAAAADQQGPWLGCVPLAAATQEEVHLPHLGTVDELPSTEEAEAVDAGAQNAQAAAELHVMEGAEAEQPLVRWLSNSLISLWSDEEWDEWQELQSRGWQSGAWSAALEEELTAKASSLVCSCAASPQPQPPAHQRPKQEAPQQEQWCVVAHPPSAHLTSAGSVHATCSQKLDLWEGGAPCSPRLSGLATQRWEPAVVPYLTLSPWRLPCPLQHITSQNSRGSGDHGQPALAAPQTQQAPGTWDTPTKSSRLGAASRAAHGEGDSAPWCKGMLPATLLVGNRCEEAASCRQVLPGDARAPGWFEPLALDYDWETAGSCEAGEAGDRKG